jgi:hypothetical protein
MLVAEHGSPTTLARIGLMRALHRGKDVGPLEQGEIGPDLFRAASPTGDPSLRGIRMTLYPVRLDRFQDPCSAANPSPQYSDGNILPL